MMMTSLRRAACGTGPGARAVAAAAVAKGEAVAAAAAAPKDPFDDAERARGAWSMRDAFAGDAADRAPLVSHEELVRLGRLAHLDVSRRDEAFRRDLSRVVGFCRALDRGEAEDAERGEAEDAERGAPAAPQQQRVSPSVMRPDAVTEGGDARAALAHAKRRVDDFFVAPRSTPGSSS